MSIKVVGIDGTVRENGRTRALLELTGESIERFGGHFELFSQESEALPIFDERESSASLPSVQRLFSAVRGADAFVLSSPEYHGSMSGALKNTLDWLAYNDESVHLEGRVFGLIGGGGSLANSGATVQMMMAVRALHGWLMPDVLVSVSDIKRSLPIGEKFPSDPRLVARIESFSEKIVCYAKEFQFMRQRLAA